MNGEKMVEDIKKSVRSAYEDADDANLTDRVHKLHFASLKAIDNLCDLVAGLYDHIERLESDRKR